MSTGCSTGTRYGVCMPGIMDAPPEARQHEDIMAQTADQLTASMERVRQARQLLLEASDRLTLTRQEVGKTRASSACVERVRSSM